MGLQRPTDTMNHPSGCLDGAAAERGTKSSVATTANKIPCATTCNREHESCIIIYQKKKSFFKKQEESPISRHHV